MHVQRIHCVLFAAFLMSVVHASPAAAQKAADRFEDLTGAVRTGDLVTVVEMDGTRVRGKVADLTIDSITIITGSKKQRRTFPATDVGRVVREDSVRNGIKIGAIIGGAAGLVLGVALNAECSNEGGACTSAIFGLAGIGAAGGAAAGWGVDRSIGNREVFDKHTPGVLSLPKEKTTEFFASMGSGQADSKRPNLLPSVAAGVGTRVAIGFGAEAEISRSLGGGTLPVGQSGTKSYTMETARIVYTFSRWRVQPFVSGGISLQQRTVRSGGLDLSTRTPYSKDSYQTRFAFPIGAGARFRVTRSIYLRPELTYSNGDQDNLFLRAAVGIVYQRR